jgi:mannose-1-phosphate guanylyltransferase
MQPDTPLHAVVMAGGVGARFWPASRRARPKQFLAIGGAEPLVVATVRRLVGLVAPERTWIVTGAEHAGLTRALLPHLPAENVLAEPRGRNTLPCVALAAAAIARCDPVNVQAVLPADHVIAPAADFRAGLAAAAEAARESLALFTFGVRPSAPATGYGYIKRGAALEPGVFAVERFVEKPGREAAEAFLADGGYLWNSGMFVWSGAAIRAAL